MIRPGGGPVDGETVLHCGHLNHNDGPHFFYFTPGLTFSPPKGGKKRRAHWIIQCSDCKARVPCGSPPESFKVKGHAVWKGDDPVVTFPIHIHSQLRI